MTKLKPEEYIVYISHMSCLLDTIGSYDSFDEVNDYIESGKHDLANSYTRGNMSHALFHAMNNGYNLILDYARVVFKRFDKESKEWFEKYGQ